MVNSSWFYKELKLQQHPNFIVPFKALFKESQPTRVIEIGTAGGGAILALKDALNELGLSSYVRTYDIKERNYRKLHEAGIDPKIKNIFSPDYQALSTEASDLVSLIQEPGTTIMLCDGGNKIQEVRLLAKYLKPSDFILAHDYSHSKAYFEASMKNKIWNWCEITHADIQDYVTEYTPFMESDFASVAWMCMKKNSNLAQR